MIWLLTALLWLLLCHISQEVNRRTLNVLIGIDQLMWVILSLGNGSPDETISAAMWRMEQQGKLAGRLLRPVVDMLFWALEREHCRKAWLAEANRQQLPHGY